MSAGQNHVPENNRPGSEPSLGRHSVAVRDVERGRQALKELFNADRITTCGPPGPFRADFHRTDLGNGVAVGQVSCSTDFAAGAAHLGAYSIDLPLSRGMQWRQGGHHGVADARTTVVFGPDEPLSIDRCGRGIVLALLVPPAVLTEHLEGLLHDQTRGGLRLEPSFTTTTDAGRRWAQLLNAFTVDRPGTGTPHPLLLPPLREALLTATLLATDHRWREHLDHPRDTVRPAGLRRVVEVIHAEPNRIHTLGELAALAHSSPRSLQEAFRRHLDTTPSRYAREIRLQAAHRELRTADPGTATVAQIASRYGFPHASRFARYYRARYGQHPHTTLREGHRSSPSP